MKNKAIIINVSEIPPSKSIRSWFKKIIPKGVKILYKQKD